MQSALHDNRNKDPIANFKTDFKLSLRHSHSHTPRHSHNRYDLDHKAKEANERRERPASRGVLLGLDESPYHSESLKVGTLGSGRRERMYDRRRRHGERQGKAEKRQTERQGRRYKDWEKEAGYERRRNMRHRTSFEENTLDGKSSNTPPDYNNNNVDIGKQDDGGFYHHDGVLKTNTLGFYSFFYVFL